jgi:hypothetical protein
MTSKPLNDGAKVAAWSDIYQEALRESNEMSTDQIDSQLARMGVDLGKLAERSCAALEWGTGKTEEADARAQGGHLDVAPASTTNNPSAASANPRVLHASNRALVVYEQPETDSSVQARIGMRDKLAEARIEYVYPGYYRLVEDPLPNTTSDGITAVENLMYEQDGANRHLLNALDAEANQYFSYRTNLFHFRNRPDRTLFDLLKRPLTHADLEEEIIEQRFPEDINTRASIVALTMALKRNQCRHIYKKRLRQALITLPVAAIAVIWPVLFQYALGVTASPPDGAISALLSAGAFGIFAAGYAMAGHALLRRVLNHTTLLVHQINGASFAGLVQRMVKLNARIRANFMKLLDADISKSQRDMKIIFRPDWPYRAKRLFKLALWQAKRIEALEKFWQIQLERIRVFDLWSNAAGNISSHLLAAGIPTLAAIAGVQTFQLRSSSLPCVWEFAGIFGAAAFVGWYFGRLSRRREYSFGMNDIAKQGIGEWDSFATVRYYEKIAAEYESGKGAFQADHLKYFTLATQPPTYSES